MAYLHCRIRTRIQTPNPMATLHYAEVFTLHGVRFRFQSQLPTKGTGLESESVTESVSGNVNEPKQLLFAWSLLSKEYNVHKRTFKILRKLSHK